MIMPGTLCRLYLYDGYYMLYWLSHRAAVEGFLSNASVCDPDIICIVVSEHLTGALHCLTVDGEAWFMNVEHEIIPTG